MDVDTVTRMFRSIAILGAGTMGAQLAALFASAGLDVVLLDQTARMAREGLDRARGTTPDPFFTPGASARILTGGFDDGLARAAACDWVLESIVEDVDAKRALLALVDQARRSGTIVSTNTSALSIAAIADGLSADFRRHWLGTHFFNPPRYLHLLELVPDTDTDPAVVERVRAFADRRLGKGVVCAKDTPGFIGNHLAVVAAFRVLDALAGGAFSVEEIDAITGPAIGRPKSATLRTLDIAGLDVFSRVAGTLAARWPDPAGRHPFELPAIVRELLARGWTGEKAGQGFYKRVKQLDGASQILALDPSTFEYRPARHVRLPELEEAAAISSAGDRLRALFFGAHRTGAFLRASLGPALLHACEVAPLIAGSMDDVDRVMRWGFGWELGPFETIDALGAGDVVAALGVREPPAAIADLLHCGRSRVREGALRPAAPDLLVMRSARERGRVVRTSPGASLVDLGDGVLAVEFHSKMNTIDADVIGMLQAGVDEASRNFRALVVGSEAANFSAGANLVLVATAAQEGRFGDIERMVATFQQTALALKYAEVPVVAAASGLTLGGGCELMLHADCVQAAVESYIGLVEVSVGLVPAGGGTKEMLLRALEARPPGARDALLPHVQRAFETIAFAKVSGSAPDATRIGYLRARDGLTMNGERLIADAKARALARVSDGYVPPARPRAIPAGGEGVLASLSLGVHLAWRAGRISDHDALVGRKLAWILAGGPLPHQTTVSETYLLELEREAFLSLCGERKTLERITYTLKTGKPLRN
jgi:3-hydroxyacyl-CoA dehydrogenase